MDALVYDKWGNSYTLGDCLGAGGQGTVFRVDRGAGRSLAVKAVLDNSTGGILRDEKQYSRYLRTIHRVRALPELPNLALPLAPLQKPCCGYIRRLMENMGEFGAWLRPADRRDLGRSLSARGGLRKRLTLLRNLADVLDQLHSRGILYGDLSPGNIFVSTKEREAEVWLIDVDNLAYENDGARSIGTPSYRAPEVALGKPNTILSDRYSFALLAYECLTFSKPFEGTLLEEEPEDGDDFGGVIYERIEWGEAPYVHEPGTANAPLYGLSRDLKQVMTPELAELFLGTFGGQGRKHPRSRPAMGRWRDAFDDACGKLLRCGNGHTYLGQACPWCTEEERQAAGPVRRYRLEARRLAALIESPETAGEDSEEASVSIAREVLCTLRWSWEAEPGGRQTLAFPVPWKALGRRGPGADAAAFEIQSRRSGCTIERNYDPKLHVKIKRAGTGGDPAGLLFTAEYQGETVEFEVVKDE